MSGPGRSGPRFVDEKFDRGRHLRNLRPRRFEFRVSQG